MKAKRTSSLAGAAFAVTAGLLSVVGTDARSANLQCGTPYTVQAGDTLSRIARQAYGSEGRFQIIYSANSNIIGPNPAMIEIGMMFELPCLGGRQVASTADSSAIKEAPTSAALPAPRERVIRVVTATDWAPFSDESQEQGGMLTEIVNVALANSKDRYEYKIDFINDWGSHLRPLISDHAYDFTAPWFKPNCDFIELLGEGSQFRCNNLDWSEPLFEQVFGYYTRSSDPAPTTYNDLLGKTICRPAGYATFMLEEKGLAEPSIELVRDNLVADCFNGLVEGRYGAVALAADTAEGTIVDLGIADQVRYNENLSQVLTLHAVIAKTNPHSADYLAQLNSGIKAIKDSGEWFSIVRRHLAAHRAKTQ